MKARRGAAVGLAVASAAALAVAVPFATADKGGNKHVKPGTPPAGAPATAPAPVVAGPSGVLEASLNTSYGSGKSDHHRNRGKSSKPAGIATISVSGNKLCYAIVTTGVDAIVKGEIQYRKGNTTLLGLPTGANPLAGNPGAVAFCLTLDAKGAYDKNDAGIDVSKLLKKPEKFVVKVTTGTGATSIVGRLHKVSRHS